MRPSARRGWLQRAVRCAQPCTQRGWRPVAAAAITAGARGQRRRLCDRHCRRHVCAGAHEPAWQRVGLLVAIDTGPGEQLRHAGHCLHTAASVPRSVASSTTPHGLGRRRRSAVLRHSHGPELCAARLVRLGSAPCMRWLDSARWNLPCVAAMMNTRWGAGAGRRVTSAVAA